MTEHAGFSGRLIYIWCKDPAKGGMLENVSIRWLDKRAFLVGQLADRGGGESDPRIGLLMWFPIDDVVMLIEYPDLNTARAAYAANEKAKAAKAAKKSGWRIWE